MAHGTPLQIKLAMAKRGIRKYWIKSKYSFKWIKLNQVFPLGNANNGVTSFLVLHRNQGIGKKMGKAEAVTVATSSTGFSRSCVFTFLVVQSRRLLTIAFWFRCSIHDAYQLDNNEKPCSHATIETFTATFTFTTSMPNRRKGKCFCLDLLSLSKRSHMKHILKDSLERRTSTQ